jgi:DNA-binding transcriptional regulator YhcF (GntR family)
MANTDKFKLSKLFGSTARVKILKFFLSRVDEQFYIRQIARELSLQLNSVRRELDNLENFGILQSVNESGETQDKKAKIKKTDKKYYLVNKNFILFEEIKALFLKAHVLYEKDFAEKVLTVGKPKLMIMTGLFVNIDNAPTDLLIVGRFNKGKLVETIRELEIEMGREFNYTVMDMKEYIYRRDITDVFLYEILENKKIVVIDELEIS